MLKAVRNTGVASLVVVVLGLAGYGGWSVLEDVTSPAAAASSRTGTNASSMSSSAQEPMDEMVQLCTRHMSEMQPVMERMMGDMMRDMMR